MSDPKRYEAMGPEVIATPTGEFVLWEDYVRLKAENEKLETEVASIGSEYMAATRHYNLLYNNLKAELTDCKSEADRLKAEVERLTAQKAVFIDREKLLVAYEQAQAEVERLRKAGDAMAHQYFDLYWSLHAESTSRYEPKSITDWNAAKDGKPTE